MNTQDQYQDRFFVTDKDLEEAKIESERERLERKLIEINERIEQMKVQISLLEKEKGDVTHKLNKSRQINLI